MRSRAQPDTYSCDKSSSSTAVVVVQAIVYGTTIQVTDVPDIRFAA